MKVNLNDKKAVDEAVNKLISGEFSSASFNQENRTATLGHKIHVPNPNAMEESIALDKAIYRYQRIAKIKKIAIFSFIIVSFLAAIYIILS